MPFVIYCLDKPGAAEIRAANRSAHLEYISRHESQVLIAGPLLTPDGAGMIGSLLVMDLANRSAVDEFCREDPYAKAGLFQSVTIMPFRKAFPK